MAVFLDWCWLSFSSPLQPAAPFSTKIVPLLICQKFSHNSVFSKIQPFSAIFSQNGWIWLKMAELRLKMAEFGWKWLKFFSQNSAIFSQIQPFSAIFSPKNSAIFSQIQPFSAIFSHFGWILAENGLKWRILAENGWKWLWLKMAEFGWKWLNFGWKWLNFGWIWLKMAEIQSNSAIFSQHSAIFNLNSAIFSQFGWIWLKMAEVGWIWLKWQKSGVPGFFSWKWPTLAEDGWAWILSDQPNFWHVAPLPESSSSGWEWLGNPRAFGQKHAGSYTIIKEFSCSLGLGENTFCRNKKQKHKNFPH